MRALGVVLAVVLAGCSTAPTTFTPTPSPTREPGMTLVTVLLDLSGPRAPSGVSQRNAMQLWIDQDQTRGQRMRATFVDLAGSDARLLVELRRAVEVERADAVVIGAPIAFDATLAAALSVGGVPVLLTLPAPEPRTLDGGGWAFALAPTHRDLARAVVADATDRGILQPTLLASDESPHAVAERLAIAWELEKRGVVAPTVVAVTAQDAAARLRGGASFARAALFTGPAATYVEATRSFAAAGLTPRVYLSYLMESSDASALREGAELATWPGSRHVAAAATTASPTPARTGFLQTYTARYGAPSTLAATAYDALGLIDAAAASGGTGREMLRERLEATTFAGIASRYSFAPARHAGFDTSDLAFLRWVSGGRGGLAIAPDPAPAPKDER
ncbi:MAG TPA: ABC transporter substrate-binding protein [Candidatus Limnocylindria bacterium]|nr:ABC transporter substrate-binding protein [Candidatus Limnocylindria bacterium]